MHFEKILIANRGEIACRVMQTAKRLGIGTVAVYSDADAGSLHVQMADEAYHIGGSAAKDSYLNFAAVIEAVKKSGAQAVHPGYGFLSENADFVAACEKSGVVFIGPPVSAMQSMGSKSAAKAIMEKAKVPLVPGYHGDNQDAAFLAEEAEKIGYPVLLKASAGGGGKGMRIVEKVEDFNDSLAAAMRESMAGFGDDHMLVEKYLTRPRHVELQVFADSQGNALHLFERDCSVQRRHQKVIEEAPAPGMTHELRRKMGDAAVAAAKAIGYVGAGTVEFLLDEDGSFYFMEMNTRLQVEHPVTEMITGQDLVEWQIKVAAGEELPCGQEDLSINGHSFEARLYAEDPQNDFLPATGLLRHLRPPAESPHVRVETGVLQGDEVSIYYDPMIAKLVVWDVDRDSALRRLRSALADYQVVGMTTNIDFLAAVAGHPAFAAVDLDTRFIDRHKNDLIPESQPASDRTLALACLEVLLQRREEARIVAGRSNDPFSPWNVTSGWRMNDDNHQEITFIDGEDEIEVTAHYRGEGYLIELSGGDMMVRGEKDANGDLLADLGGTRIKATVARHGDDMTIMCQGVSHKLTVYDAAAHAGEDEAPSGSLTAPMPGKVVDVHVKPGDKVSKGDPLLVLEAMKMEHTISAPTDGVIAEINYGAGEQVVDGAELLSLETE
ncbi:MAG: acetyl/propionyl/methylcrotonyl-CoA carboxylase subunit alpha [Rhodospirillales bacterium]|nr:acetyl/propionyl/methylcrotonyl-CoA carboxylase subunit alpha [Rhodospirillales bacterium]